MTRGTFQFEVTPGGDLVDSAANVECLRKLWLDRSMIFSDDDIGPGNDGDFDHGAWHSACHLVGAGGVRRAADGKILWLEVSHDRAKDEYYASVTPNGGATHRLDSAEARALLNGSTLLGFVEGNSVGHISARGVNDPPTLFNLWKRQDFDQPATSSEDGGKVWEHWCTVRDIRPPHKIGSSVLRAYVSLAAALGDKFVPTVARGRRDYGHPKQLCAMVKAGMTTAASATWDIKPHRVPDAAEMKLLEARPGDEAAAVATLEWDATPRYYMFQRRISHWSPADKVKHDLHAFGL
jgi:hypothetical protein